MSASDVRQALQALEMLVSPEENVLKDPLMDTDKFKHILSLNINKIEAWVSSNEHIFVELDSLPLKCQSSDNIEWDFVLWNLKMLQLLHYIINSKGKCLDRQLCTESSDLSSDSLGAKDQHILLTSLQFVTVLGICPYLLPGVGIPLEKRTTFHNLLHPQHLKKISFSEGQWRLWKCLNVIMDLVNFPSVGNVILSKSFGDILAGLIQLSHGPKVKPHVLKESTTVCLEKKDYDGAKTELSKLLANIYPPLAVRELLLLQSGGQIQNVAPTWLVKCCGEYLTNILLRPKKGLQFILRGMLDPYSDKSNSSDWEKCEAAAKVISSCPSHRISKENYYAHICPQVLELLHLQDQNLAKQFLRVARSCIISMYLSDKKLARTYLLSPLVQPLLACIDRSVKIDGKLCVEEIEICLQDLHKILSDVAQSDMALSLSPIIHPLFNIFHSVRRTSYSKKSHLLDILSRLFKNLEMKNALHYLAIVSFRQDKAPKSKSKVDNMPSKNILDLNDFIGKTNEMNDSLKVLCNKDGRIHVESVQSLCPHSQEEYEEKANSVILLLKECKSDELVAEFFLQLLETLTSIIQEDTAPDITIRLPGLPVAPLEMHRIEHCLELLNILGKMSEELSTTCFSKTGHILHFVKVTLERGVIVLTNTTSTEFGLFESETLTMAMGLLTAVMGGGSPITQQDRETTKSILPLLETLANAHPDESVQEMANDLRIAIATHGMVLSDFLKQKQDAHVKEPNNPTIDITCKARHEELLDMQLQEVAPPARKVLIEEIGSQPQGTSSSKMSCTNSESRNMNSVSHHISKDSQNINIESSVTSSNITGQCSPSESHGISSGDHILDKALNELMDPLVPVRGHGLITLRKLVEAGDKNALKNQDALYKIFKENVEHTDSYIYLAALQGLASLADRYPDVVPAIAEEYVKKGQNSRSLDVRLKLGEVLVKTSQKIGGFVTQYRDVLINAFLTSAKDEDPLIRASAISNLGEVCKSLNYALHGIIYEVLNCVEALLTMDPEVPVRQAAAMFLTLLLQGLGQNAMKILDAALRDLYRLVKRALQTEKEETVKQHLLMAMNELDEIMKKFLFPKETLEKKISILDPPDSWW